MQTRYAVPLLLLLGLLLPASARAVGEYELKAAFLYNFALYTEWPSQHATLQFCVMGNDPFGDAMQPITRKTVRGATVRSMQVYSVAEARGCQLLFIAASERGNLPYLAEQLREVPVLTVTESNGLAPSPAIIALVSANNRIEFEINQSAAQQVGLKLSSHLLKLARKVW
ncbi:YfiR family protein [Ferriphaselus sp. R-1]|uniref:YfiR family protein n=1 Tax=Ferriphaselus sp. R-1 TaxID=1485544 RepID=UPI000690FD22|nr:YfiR family protein [Ferriphaselus sp. R-1]